MKTTNGLKRTVKQYLMALRRFGTKYGGFYYPKTLDGLTQSSVIYCVGAGEDILHDVELAYITGAEVHIFDPTPRSIEHVNLVKQVLETKIDMFPNRRYGGGDVTYWPRILDNPANPNQLVFHPYGLYTEDNAAMRFYTPTNTEYVSHSLVKGMKSADYIEIPVKSLRTIMSELGHTTIDLLKIDIEGCECDVLDAMLDDNVYPRYLSVDFDLGWTGEQIRDKGRCLKVIERLQSVGYTLLHAEGADHSFARSPDRTI